MKFSIEKSVFVSGLQQVVNVVEPRVIMPILSNVLLECTDDGLSITATNLDIAIHCKVRAEVEQIGKISLPAKKLLAVIRSLPNNNVKLDMIGTKVKISSGQSNFQIMGLLADEFPAITSPGSQQKFALPQVDMARMLKNVSFAQSNDDNRYILNSVYFCFEDDKLTFAATDGRRLSLVSRAMECVDGNKGFIVPSKTVRELERLLCQGDEISFVFDHRQLQFTISVREDNKDGLIDKITVVSKLVEGNYPNFRQIIPQTTDHRVKLDRELALESIQRVAIMANDQKNLVKLTFQNNAMEISAESQEYGAAQEKLAIMYDDAPISIAFNYMFLCDVLKILTQDEVFFEFKDELSAGVFKTTDHFLYVVMPLRMG